MFSIEAETAGDPDKVQQCVSFMKELTHLLDQLLRIRHVLGLNSKIVHCMIQASTRYEQNAKCRNDFNLCAEAVQVQYGFLREMTESLLARGNNLSRQVCLHVPEVVSIPLLMSSSCEILSFSGTQNSTIEPQMRLAPAQRLWLNSHQRVPMKRVSSRC